MLHLFVASVLTKSSLRLAQNVFMKGCFMNTIANPQSPDIPNTPPFPGSPMPPGDPSRQPDQPRQPEISQPIDPPVETPPIEIPQPIDPPQSIPPIELPPESSLQPL